MNLLPKWNLTGTLPAFKDGESATTIEQTYKLYQAMQELITEYNAFVDSTNTKISEFTTTYKGDIEVFTTSIRQEFQDFIDVVDLKIQSLETSTNDSIGSLSSMIAGISNTTNTKIKELESSINSIIAQLPKPKGELFVLTEDYINENLTMEDGDETIDLSSYDNIYINFNSLESLFTRIKIKENTRLYFDSVGLSGNFDSLTLVLIDYPYNTLPKRCLIVEIENQLMDILSGKSENVVNLDFTSMELHRAHFIVDYVNKSSEGIPYLKIRRVSYGEI